MDQLQLPADVVGQLLLLLQDVDIQCVRLVCKSWKQAVDHQLRTIRPLYLPPGTATVFSNCSSLQGQLLRRVKLPGGINSAGTLPHRGFSWRAPLRNFPTLSVTAPHTVDLDLSGQCLPADCIAQLAQHLTRLGSLKLERCTLLESALCDLVLFQAAAAAAAAADATAVGRDSGLHRLSLAGVQTCTEPQGSLAASAEHGPTRLTDILDAIAANPLTHLNLDSWCTMVSASNCWCWGHSYLMLHAVLHTCFAFLDRHPPCTSKRLLHSQPKASCSQLGLGLRACTWMAHVHDVHGSKCKSCTCTVIKACQVFTLYLNLSCTSLHNLPSTFAESSYP